MIDISKGRYWDLPWSLVSGCTPCSPGCDHCWSAAMTYRFHLKLGKGGAVKHHLTNINGKFNGYIELHPERLSIPLKRRKPTVYAVWNDLFHESVPDEFFSDVMMHIGVGAMHHKFLILSKRPERMAETIDAYIKMASDQCGREVTLPQNIFWGLTVVNQQEADEKIPVFLQVPGKKFLSIEPMLGAIDIEKWLHPRQTVLPDGYGGSHGPGWITDFRTINAVILGGETGPGSRPVHPDWVRSVRDQCAAAGVPFFFKQNGEWLHETQEMPQDIMFWNRQDHKWPDGSKSYRVGRKKAGRLLDGRTHDDLPWVK
ncbi:MAG: Phage protein Gp37/Gp68 [Syntrophus sp. PtaB.Bin001]|nr:MAG: Phage protein Gp37/Gp68 [Syntrophus sp. PtaB.Bin001]